MANLALFYVQTLIGSNKKRAFVINYFENWQKVQFI